MTKFETIAKAKAQNGFLHAIHKSRKGHTVVYHTGFCWKFVKGGKVPMDLQSAKFLFDLCVM